MKAIYKKRLLTLAKFLRTVPKKRFKMGQWFTGEFCGRANEVKHNECGTAACAAGWACTVPSLKKDGLKMDPEGGGWPVYGDEYGFAAVANFFGLPRYYSPSLGEWPEDYIFGDGKPNCPVKAANRIERYIKLTEKGDLK